jgi:hypothetical protein
MAEKGLEKKDLEQIFTGFEKRQDEKFKAFEGRMDLKLKDLEGGVVNQFHIISEGLMDPIKLLAEGHRRKTWQDRKEERAPASGDPCTHKALIFWIG